MDDQPQENATAIAPDADAPLTNDERAQAKQYGRLELLCSLADKALDVGFLSVMAFVFARPLDAWLGGFIARPTVRLAALFLVTILLHMAVSFPLSVYSGHVLEHRFGLSQQTFGRWLARYVKRNALAIAFGLVMFVGLYWIIWLTGSYWWLVAAAGFFVISVLLGQLMPVLILPLFYKIERLDRPDLAERIARLAAGTGLSIEGVYRLEMSAETVKANAMLAGLGRTRRVLIGDTLLDSFTPDEIEVIFAHEIGHHVFRHIHQMIAAGAVFSAAGFWLCDRLLMAWVARQAGAVDHANLPVWTLPLVMLILTAFGLVLEPLQNIISRYYERQCDRYALERTRLVEAYRSAFRKLARLNKDDPDPHRVEVFLFHSHPPISERLRMADEE